MVMDKKRIVSIVVMVVGLVTLVVGAIFLVLKLNEAPGVADGEYLVTAGSWVLEDGSNCVEAVKTETVVESDSEAAVDSSETVDVETNCIGESGVIWNFTEIGKGTLTTNKHKNDYDFAWALEDGKMLIHTDWLYELDNEYNYQLDQGAGTLVLSDGENEYRFVAQTE